MAEGEGERAPHRARPNRDHRRRHRRARRRRQRLPSPGLPHRPAEPRGLDHRGRDDQLRRARTVVRGGELRLPRPGRCRRRARRGSLRPRREGRRGRGRRGHEPVHRPGQGTRVPGHDRVQRRAGDGHADHRLDPRRCLHLLRDARDDEQAADELLAVALAGLVDRNEGPAVPLQQRRRLRLLRRGRSGRRGPAVQVRGLLGSAQGARRRGRLHRRRPAHPLGRGAGRGGRRGADLSALRRDHPAQGIQLRGRMGLVDLRPLRLRPDQQGRRGLQRGQHQRVHPDR